MKPKQIQKRIVDAKHRHTNNNASAPKKRCADSVVIQITTTKSLAAVLDEVVKTGFFGTSRAAAAERLLAEAIRQQLREGTIQRRQKVFQE